MATFDCAVCHDDSLPKDGVYPIPNTELFVCTDCLRGMKQRFEQHLNFEHTYPETWGQIILRPHDFPVFTQDLLDKYAKKEVEYSIQVRERLYCQYYYLSGVSPIHFLPLDDTDTQDSLRTQCDSFLGRKQAEKFRVRCGKCQGPSCTKCGDPLQPEVPLNAHSCAQEPDDVPEAFRRPRAWTEIPALPRLQDSSGAQIRVQPHNLCEPRMRYTVLLHLWRRSTERQRTLGFGSVLPTLQSSRRRPRGL